MTIPRPEDHVHVIAVRNLVIKVGLTKNVSVLRLATSLPDNGTYGRRRLGTLEELVSQTATENE